MPLHLVLINANGLVLAPAVLAHAWCQIPEERRRGVYAYVSPRNIEWLLSTAIPAQMIEREQFHRGVFVYYFAGAPVIKQVYMQDELVSFMDDDANICAQIKNLAPPSPHAPF